MLSIEDIKLDNIEIDYNNLYNIINKWKNTLITEKQYKLLVDILVNINYNINLANNPRLEIVDLINKVNKIDSIEDKNNFLKSINKYHALLLIDYLNKINKISENMIEILKNNITIEEINNILSKYNIVYSSYEEITYYYFKIITRDMRFSFKNINSEFVPKRINLPLTYSASHEFGISKEKQSNSYIYYIKFYDLLVLDFDGLSYEDLKSKLKPLENLFLFRIYKTFNGFHVFIMSEKIQYNSVKALDIAKILKCDPWYAFYFKYHGYCIRISKKINREEEFIHKYVSDIGNKEIDKDLAKLVKYLEDIENNLPEVDLTNYKPIHHNLL